MAYTYNIPNMSSGVDETLLGLANTTTFINKFLFFIFAIIFIGGMASQKKKTGYADAPMWAFLSSLATLILVLIFSMRDGMINSVIYFGVFGLTIMCSIWLFLDRRQTEV